jgi:plasmid replication initiation protein
LSPLSENTAALELVPRAAHTSNRLIVQHNALAEARYRLSLRAQKLLIRLIAELDSKSDDLNEVTLNLKDFAEFATIDRNDATYSHFVETAEQFLGRFVAITQSPIPGEPQARQLICHWISSLEKNPNDKSIAFSFDKKLKPYLLGLKRTFFAYRTLHAFNLNSTYAIRLYQWAKAREYLKRPQRVPVDDLRCSLGTIELNARGVVVKESLRRYADFKRVAFKPAQTEINQKTDINLIFKEIKQPGSKIVAELLITIRQKENAPANTAFKIPLGSQIELELVPPSPGEPAPNGLIPTSAESERLLAGEVDLLLDEIRRLYQLTPKQRASLILLVQNKGVGYVREKLTLTQSEPRENPTRFFLAALRDDYKPSAAKRIAMNKPPRVPPEPPGWLDWAKRMYPEADYPGRFRLLPTSVQEEYLAELRRAAGKS